MGFTIAPATRTHLQVRVGQTVQVVAVFDRRGENRAKGQESGTVLVRDVRDVRTGELLADHLWFNNGSTWKKAALKRGDVVVFEARVIEYRVGHWGQDTIEQVLNPPRIDYRLKHACELKLVWRPMGLRVRGACLN
jgi:hypothetical protein